MVSNLQNLTHTTGMTCVTHGPEGAQREPLDITTESGKPLLGATCCLGISSNTFTQRYTYFFKKVGNRVGKVFTHEKVPDDTGTFSWVKSNNGGGV